MLAILAALGTVEDPEPAPALSAARLSRSAVGRRQWRPLVSLWMRTDPSTDTGVVVADDLVHLVAGDVGGGAGERGDPADGALGHLVAVTGGGAEGGQLLAGLGARLGGDADADDGPDDAAVNEAADVTHVCSSRSLM